LRSSRIEALRGLISKEVLEFLGKGSNRRGGDLQTFPYLKLT